MTRWWADGEVPHRLAGATVRGPLIEMAPTEALFRLPSVGRFLVRASPPAIVARAVGATDDDVECFLRGPVRALGALLAGRLALQATAVEVGGRALLLAGPSGAGKSALGAILAGRGYRVVADGVAPITADGKSVTATSHELQLWPDVAALMDLDPAAARVVRLDLGKRAYRWPHAGGELPFSAVVVVGVDRRLRSTRIEMEEQHGFAKVQSLASSVWHSHLIGPMGLAGDHFGWLTAIAGRHRVVQVRRPLGPVETGLPGLADIVAELPA